MKKKYNISNLTDVDHCVKEMQKLNDALFEMELEFQGQEPVEYPEGYTDVDIILFYHGNALKQIIEGK